MALSLRTKMVRNRQNSHPCCARLNTIRNCGIVISPPRQGAGRGERLMINKQILDDIADQISRRLPQLNALGQDVSDSVKGLVQQSLGKLDLVTREEFDAQIRALQRAEAKIAELEAAVNALESRLKP
ncbi:accessory factor UbiK family protein [Gammaproteobacteria bacterium LSUCC0112]|nr:accessory factor UbiK family protein [Gammaproteobacteria bacterium LSUCC0112]